MNPEKEKRKTNHDLHYFGGLRSKVLERDNYSCQRCNITNKHHHLKFNRDLTVDHIDGRGRYSSNKNNTLANLITLCLSCHSSKDNYMASKNCSFEEFMKPKFNKGDKVTFPRSHLFGRLIMEVIGLLDKKLTLRFLGYKNRNKVINNVSIFDVRKLPNEIAKKERKLKIFRRFGAINE